MVQEDDLHCQTIHYMDVNIPRYETLINILKEDTLPFDNLVFQNDPFPRKALESLTSPNYIFVSFKPAK
jgi:hypothetical protein